MVIHYRDVFLRVRPAYVGVCGCVYVREGGECCLCVCVGGGGGGLSRAHVCVGVSVRLLYFNFL